MLKQSSCYARHQKAGMVNYEPGDEEFSLVEGKDLLPSQKKALDVVSSVFSKIHSTGIQKILNTAVFDSLKFIVVYPVEDESKLTNKDGEILPDAKLLPEGSTAKDLAGTIHADMAKGSYMQLIAKQSNALEENTN